ncbi:MAG: hypothetical protein JWM96_1366, partial [Alphaproteobacteria bacterium]|nr:hypothetical protein [Alphaproteobacteria bacterium]
SDTITPNGDRFFESEEDAFNIFQDEMQKNIWPHAYAPEKWHMADNNNIRELSLKNMLDDLATTTLTPTNITAMFGGETMRNAALGFIGLLMLVMAGFVLYSLFAPADIGPLPSTRTPEQIAATARIMTLNAPKGKAADAVSPRQLLKQCGTAAAGLYVSMPGWTPASFTCASGKAAMAWQQKKGSLSDAKAIGLKTWPPATAVALANRILTATTTLGSLPKVETAALPIQEQALLYLEQNLQPLGALQVKPVVPPAPPVPKARTSMLSAAPAPAPPPPRLPSYLDIQMSSGFSPDQMAPLLEQPGLELLKLDWNITSGVWQYKVKWTYDTPAPVAPAAPAKPGAAPANAAVPAVVPNAAASPAGPVTPQQPGIAGNTAAAARQLQPVNPAPISPSAPEGR